MQKFRRATIPRMSKLVDSGDSLLSPSIAQRLGDVASQTARAFIGIRELLLHGEVARGERLSELPLVARLGMSRTPIRLALERLPPIGLFQTPATGGFCVREFTLAEVQDAIEVRGVLEGTAARLAAERLTDSSELASAEHHFRRMERLQGRAARSVPGDHAPNAGF